MARYLEMWDTGVPTDSNMTLRLWHGRHQRDDLLRVSPIKPEWPTHLLARSADWMGQQPSICDGTVASVLRVMGLGQDRHFQNFHRVLNRDRWASRMLSKILFRLLVDAFVPKEAPVVVGVVTRLRLDAALYDPPPERVPGTKGRPRRKGERQPALQARLRDPQTAWQRVVARWYGGTERVIEVAIGTALWYHGGMPTVPLRWVLIRDPQGTFEPQSLLCTDQDVSPPQIIEWFVLRWQLEVTFHEARTHLEVETQRQWADLAITRTTPALLGLFSLVTLVAQQVLGEGVLPTRQAAWYKKAVPTFADTLALVRPRLWPIALSEMSVSKTDMVQIPRVVFERFATTLAYAA